jgi:hypothetical protein
MKLWISILMAEAYFFSHNQPQALIFVSASVSAVGHTLP